MINFETVDGNGGARVQNALRICANCDRSGKLVRGSGLIYSHISKSVYGISSCFP